MGLLLNFGMFKVGWLSSVMGGAKQMPWLGPLAMLVIVAIHLYRARQPERELILILACGFIGAIFDSVLVTFGWVGYASGLFVESMAPYWIISMWMLFATTLNVSLRWLRGRYVLAAVLGAIAGPMAYLGGQKLGGMMFYDTNAGVIALSIGWGLMMPLLVYLAERLDGIGEAMPKTEEAQAQA